MMVRVCNPCTQQAKSGEKNIYIVLILWGVALRHHPSMFSTERPLKSLASQLLFNLGVLGPLP